MKFSSAALALLSMLAAASAGPVPAAEPSAADIALLEALRARVEDPSIEKREAVAALTPRAGEANPAACQSCIANWLNHGYCYWTTAGWCSPICASAGGHGGGFKLMTFSKVQQT